MDFKNFGFIILSPDHNIGGLKGTVRSIINNYSSSTNIICITGKNTKQNQIKEMKEVCKTYKGGDTITSLINTGLEKGHEEWNIIIMEGSWVKKNLHLKYSKWIESYKDVLYSIFINYNKEGYPIKVFKDFEECSLNGICINRNLFKEVGKFSDDSLNVSRLLWSLEAKSKQANFKGILGIKII
jgi:hypothetical protein